MAGEKSHFQLPTLALMYNGVANLFFGYSKVCFWELDYCIMALYEAGSSSRGHNAEMHFFNCGDKWQAKNLTSSLGP